MIKTKAPKVYKIYWIYDGAIHKDPWTEGYVGCTTQALSKRYGHHKHQKYSVIQGKATKSLKHMYKFINEAIDPQYEELCRTTNADRASELEFLYRSEPNIGENRYVGGYRIGEQKCIYALDGDGNRYDYESLTEAARDGFSLCGVHSSLRMDKRYSTSANRGKCKFYYA